MDIQEIVAKLKDNKYALPALAVGAGLGIFVIVRRGGFSSNSVPEITAPQSDQANTSSVSDGSSAPTNDNQITDLQQQQQNFQQGITQTINDLIDNVSSALSQQQQQTQQAIDSAISSIPNPNFPDYSSYSDLGSIFSQFEALARPQVPVELSYVSPDIPGISQPISPKSVSMGSAKRTLSLSLPKINPSSKALTTRVAKAITIRKTTPVSYVVKPGFLGTSYKAVSTKTLKTTLPKITKPTKTIFKGRSKPYAY